MHLTCVTIGVTSPSTVDHLDAPMTVDLIWASVRPDDGVEHIAVHRAGDRMEVGVFSLAADEATAESNAGGLVRRALANSPPLRNWIVLVTRSLHLETTPFPPEELRIRPATGASKKLPWIERGEN
jgi:hypothetical protein